MFLTTTRSFHVGALSRVESSVVVVVVALVFFTPSSASSSSSSFIMDGGGGVKKQKRYTLASVRIKPNQESKIRNAAMEHRSVAIFILPNKVGSEGGSKSDDDRDSKQLEMTGTLLLTQKQQLKLNSSPKKKGGGGWIKILLSPRQLAENREYGRGDENNYVGSLMKDNSSSPKNNDEIPDRDAAADASTIGDDDDRATTENKDNNNNTIVDAVVDDDAKGQIVAATGDSSSSSSSKKKNKTTRSKPASKKASKSVVKKRRKKKVVLTENGDDSDEEHYIYRTEDCRHILMSPESSSGSGIWLRPFRGVIAPHQKRYMKKYGEGVYLRRNSAGHGALRKVSDGLEFGRF
jgi:hypothetical protein